MQRCSGFNWFCPILSEDHTIHYTKSWPEKDPASCDVIITRPVALCGKSTKSILWVKKDSSYFIIRHMPDKIGQNKWKASFLYIYIVNVFTLYSMAKITINTNWYSKVIVIFAIECVVQMYILCRYRESWRSRPSICFDQFCLACVKLLEWMNEEPQQE